MKEQEIVHIAEIISTFERVFDELIKFVQINIGEKLAGQIADGQTAINFAKKRFMRRHGLQKFRIAFSDVIFGRIVENNFFSQP